MLIDPHKAIKELTETGVLEEHAEAIVTVVTRSDEQVKRKTIWKQWKPRCARTWKR